MHYLLNSFINSIILNKFSVKLGRSGVYGSNKFLNSLKVFKYFKNNRTIEKTWRLTKRKLEPVKKK